MGVKSSEGTTLSHDPAKTVKSELDEARWSIVSFDRREANGLSYSEAAELMSKLYSDGVAGLCIVTDAAAERMSR